MSASTPPPTTATPNSPTDLPLLIALSGPTSSGKTTLATALSRILPGPPLIIHADDFYRPDSQIPVTAAGLQNWDCAGALDVEKFEMVLGRVREGEEVGEEGLVRQGDFERDGKGDGVHYVKGIEGAVVEQLEGDVRGWWPEQGRRRRVVLVDGFLLFGESVREQLGRFFDVKILLRARFGDAKARRESRNGYVTLEGFWQDPPRYFEDVVWPGFVAEHGFLFERGDVEGEPGGRAREVKVAKLDMGLEEMLEWVLGEVRRVSESGKGED